MVKLKQMVGYVAISSFLLTSPYISYAGGITGSTTKNEQYQRENRENYSKEGKGLSKEKREKIAERFLDFIPHSKIIKPAVKAGRWAAEKQQEKGHGTGLGSTVKKRRK